MLHLVGKIALVIVSTALALLAGEVLIRIINPPPRPLSPLPIPSYQLSDNPIIEYEFRPGYSPTERPFDWSHKGYAINSDGFRDLERQVEKPADTYRILVVGDSTTAGNGVPKLEDLYTQVLESMLNADAADAKKYEVFNMGVGGYQPMQAAETLRAKGLKYDPDLVILTLCMNDYTLHADGLVYSMLSKLNVASRDRPSEDLHRLMSGSRLVFNLYHRLHTTVTAHDRWYRDTILQGRSPVAAGLQLLSATAVKAGFHVLVLILPEFVEPFDNYRTSDIHDRMHADAQGLDNITLVDLFDRFRKVDPGASSFSYDGLHLNEYGHRVTAQFIYPLVRAEIESGG